MILMPPPPPTPSAETHRSYPFPMPIGAFCAHKVNEQYALFKMLIGKLLSFLVFQMCCDSTCKSSLLDGGGGGGGSDSVGFTRKLRAPSPVNGEYKKCGMTARDGLRNSARNECQNC